MRRARLDRARKLERRVALAEHVEVGRELRDDACEELVGHRCGRFGHRRAEQFDARRVVAAAQTFVAQRRARARQKFLRAQKRWRVRVLFDERL